MTKTKIPSPIGTLTAETEEGFVFRLELGGDSRADSVPSDDTARQLIRELDEYFRGERTAFSLKVRPAGTPFQQAVWAQMRKIPYGQTKTYGELAEAIGKPGASRAVGHVCHINPILLLIPCHRVVGASGIGGFAHGTDLKRVLLGLERDALTAFRHPYPEDQGY